MGMLMMLNFVTGSIAIGIYSRIVDLDAGLAWNPLTAVPRPGMVYSNLFLVLAMLWVIVYLSYYLRMRKRKA